MVSAPLMQLQSISVAYRVRSSRLFGHETVYALTDADLVINAGETVGIVGESGCGKTTLAKVLVGLQRPTAGSVVYQGQALWQMPASDRRRKFGSQVAMVFQNPSTALNRRLSVATMIGDPLVIHKVGTIASRRERVRELIDLVGLPASVADALPGQLSGGQRQRVAIARAVALNPSLLIADEPTSALDVSVRAQILNLLVELRERLGLAIVFISHDIQTIRKMTDRIVTMYLGRIVETGPSSSIPQAVYHPYTQALFSATPGLLSPPSRIILHGPVPSATHPPSGCHFRTRCWKATDECAAARPPLSTVPGSPDHTYRCIHPEQPNGAAHMAPR
jgi:peptide/nickel transport system ATP-binding protein